MFNSRACVPPPEGEPQPLLLPDPSILLSINNSYEISMAGHTAISSPPKGCSFLCEGDNKISVIGDVSHSQRAWPLFVQNVVFNVKSIHNNLVSSSAVSVRS